MESLDTFICAEPPLPTRDSRASAAGDRRAAAGLLLVAAALVGHAAIGILAAPRRPEPKSIDLRLDLRLAGRQELEALPGVGQVLAGRIINARESGVLPASDDPQDLCSVPGIGPGRLAAIRLFLR
ncbi:MAG: ComEA family DNA-binding protein [Phycisphaerales bacterium]